MNNSEFDKRIIALFERRKCFESESKEICGPNRAKLKDGRFFPPPFTYIGPKYAEADPKIFALAINQNLSKEVPCSFDVARNSLRDPQPWYGPLENMERICQIIFKSLTNEEIGDDRVRDFISFSNFVKCSSHQTRGNPTDQMVKNCTEFTLEEIEILNPDIVICMGGPPFDRIWFGIKNKYTRFLEPQDYDFYSFRYKMNDKIVKVIRVYHYGDMRTINRIADYLKRCSHGEKAKTKFYLMNEFFEVAFGKSIHLKDYYGKLMEMEKQLNNYYEHKKGDKHTPPLLAKFLIHELVERVLKDS
jgi:hypothetical protein